MKTDAILKKEFELVNQLRPCNRYLDYDELSSLYPSAMNNFSQNRYRDVLPEEYSRVRLKKMNEEHESDYINANYISVHKETYISCQAPLPCTTSQFWAMIYEQESPVIVMLTRITEGDRKKADVYWPSNEYEKNTYGKLSVSLKSTTKLPLITIRVLVLTRLDTKEEREVVHLHYTEWPDFGVPETTHKLRELIQLLNIYKERGASKGLEGPIVAHCSAGIGRCGTFFAILIALEKLTEGESFENLNLLEIVLSMRKARCGMVQTDGQYAFIYRVLDDIVKEKQIKLAAAKRINANSYRLSFDELPPLETSDEEKVERRCSFGSISSELSAKRLTYSISCHQ